MRIVIISDVFPPLRSSGAVQLRDLSKEFVRQGHDVTVLVASPDLEEPWQIDTLESVKVARLKTLPTKGVNYLQRTIGEFFMPFAMLRNFRKSPLSSASCDAIIWYSPTIFLGPLVKAMKSQNRCPAYLIIRDIFPEWAVDMGLMGRGIPYLFFRAVARSQYRLANIIGIQTPGNKVYFEGQSASSAARIEVLQNWLGDPNVQHCSIDISRTVLAGRKIFVYAGNMGIAQGMGILLELAECLKHRTDLGFLFVGRGSDAQRLRLAASQMGLHHVVFFDEIDPDQIPALYEQCHVGLVALDPRHRTHNIPGKFLTYMQAGLPVLATINRGNDLVQLIERERVGIAHVEASAESLAQDAERLIVQIESDGEITNRCRHIAKKLFSAEAAVKQIVDALSNKDSVRENRPSLAT
jgi:glycosyltransferase involved in cell wall biosynthesis